MGQRDRGERTYGTNDGRMMRGAPTLLILAVVTSAASWSMAAHGRSAPAAADPWTVCMAADTAADTKIVACTATLQQRHVSPFQQSLLIASRGDAYAWLNRFSDAIADFDRALRLDPEGAEDTLVRRGIAFERSGRYARSLKDYERAIRDHARDPANRTNGSQEIDAEEHALRGRVLLKLGRPAAAYRELSVAVVRSPIPDLAVADYPGGVGAEVVTLRSEARVRSRGSH